MGSIRGRSPVSRLAGLQAALHAEHPGHREPGDVGVEQPDVRPRAARPAARLTVTEDLPDPALARRDGQHPGAARDLGGRRVAPGPGGGPGP